MRQGSITDWKRLKGMVSRMTRKTTRDGGGNVISETVDTVQQNSIEIAMNAKGDVSWKVKVYEDDPEKMKRELKNYMDIAKECK